MTIINIVVNSYIKVKLWFVFDSVFFWMSFFFWWYSGSLATNGCCHSGNEDLMITILLAHCSHNKNIISYRINCGHGPLLMLYAYKLLWNKTMLSKCSWSEKWSEGNCLYNTVKIIVYNAPQKYVVK